MEQVYDIDNNNNLDFLFEKKENSYVKNFDVRRIDDYVTRKSRPLSEASKIMIRRYNKIKPEGRYRIVYPPGFEESYFEFIKEALCDLENGRNVAVGIAVLITMCTNLRSGEIAQLRFRHLKNLLEGSPVDIKIKNKKSFMTIITNKKLLLRYLKYFGQCKDEEDRLVKRSVSYINKKIRRALRPFDVNTIGLKIIRKINTTLIYKYTNDPTIIQAINRHQSSKTAKKYYISENVGNRIGGDINDFDDSVESSSYSGFGLNLNI